jgi:vacuolar-type H+-ATPase subunit C/Vma6
METGLLTPSDVERITRSDLGSLGAVLQELGLVPEGTDAVDSAALDKALEERLDETLSVLRSMVPERELFDLFLLRRDVRNIEMILKSRAAGVPAGEMTLEESGLFSAEKLKEDVLTDHLELLPDALKEMTRAAIKACEVVDNPFAAVAHTLAREYLLLSLRLAEEKGERWFRAWAGRRIDLHNVGAFLRAKAEGLPLTDWEASAVAGGETSLLDFRAIWSEPLESLVERFQFTAYGRLIAQGVTGWKEHGDLIDWERAKAEFELSALEGTRTETTFSAGPMLLYWLRREAETRLVRSVAVAKRLNRSLESVNRMAVKTDA